MADVQHPGSNAPDDLPGRFLAHARALLPSSGSLLLVAVSGGADSIALLELLVRGGGWRLAAYHLDHALRAESADDADAVAARCAALGVTLIRERVDVAAEARLRRESLEAAGRRVRYRRLEAAARRLGAQAVLTAHHRDDQAETVLMHLLRGAGAVGIAGIPAARDLEGVPLLRPLLPFARDELRAWLRTCGVDWREDASNADAAFRRNRVRLRVLPRLEAAEPGFAAALLSAAARAETPPDAPGGDGMALAGLAELPRTRRGDRWRALLARLGIEPSRERIARLDALVRAREGAQARLGGWRFVRDRGAVAWERAMAPARPADVVVASPGEHRRGDQRLSLIEQAPPGDARTGPGEAWLDADAVRWPLVWRTVRTDDRWRPLGSPGSQPVAKHLAARRVPPRVRSAIAVLADTDGVIWVPGFGVAQRVRIGAATRRALHGKVVPPPGPRASAEAPVTGGGGIPVSRP